jgi:uncharacterized membrane protein (DUF106 family)
MWPILRAITKAFDALLLPFARLHPWVGLTVVSVVTGVVMLFIFGKTSNQTKIAETKAKLRAYVMEMWIFRNSTVVMFKAIGNVLRNNLQYLRHSLRPLVFLIIPVLVIMVQLGIRYQNEPLMPGDTAVVSVNLKDGTTPSRSGLELVAPKGVRVVSPALRIDAKGEIDWEIKAEQPGRHEIALVAGDETVRKVIEVGPSQRVGVVGAIKARANSWNAFLYPGEEPVPPDSVIESISVTYPHRELRLLGLNVHWLVAFFIISVAAGFALKGVFGIEV